MQPAQPGAERLAARALVALDVRPLRLGDEGDAVRQLQRGLAKLGAKVEPSGVYDAATKDAVAHFQEASHLKPSGVLTAKTAATLFNKLFWERGYALELNREALKGLPASVRIEVDQKHQRANLLDAKTGELLRSYPVSTGTKAYPTPLGSFRITQISEKPTWYPPNSPWVKNHEPVPPGPNNPLGPAMMRLGSTTILFHGVPAHEWDSIGKARASHGCMRMLPQDAWELHHIVERGVQVDIQAP